MTIFQVRDARSRAILWTGVADDADHAVEAAALAACFRCTDDLPSAMHISLSAEALTIRHHGSDASIFLPN